MNMDLYRVFYLTAQEKNFSKAAAKLFITQPSVSFAMKQLEEQLGVLLFIRTSKGVEMTSEEELLFTYIQQAFGLIEEAERKMEELKNLESGQVTIGGSDSTCKHYLLPYIQSFQERYPHIQIKLQPGSTPRILEKLTNGMLDIGIVHLPVQEKHITITDFLTISSAFVVGKKYKHLADKTQSLEELLSYSIISFSEASSSRRFLNQLFAEQGVNVSPDIEVGSVELLIECAKIGMGIAFVTKELILKELEEGELFEIPLDSQIAERQIGIATKKALPLSMAAKTFYDFLSEE